MQVCNCAETKEIGKYKDPESWGCGTKGFEYGRKTHVALDVDSTALGEWKVTTASLHDSIMAIPIGQSDKAEIKEGNNGSRCLTNVWTS